MRLRNITEISVAEERRLRSFVDDAKFTQRQPSPRQQATAHNVNHQGLDHGVSSMYKCYI